MTPATQKLVDVATAICEDHIHDDEATWLPLANAISAVEAEAATGYKKPTLYRMWDNESDGEADVYLPSEVDPILTAIRALVEKGMQPLALSGDFLDEGIDDRLGFERAGRKERERQFTELLSQIGSILGGK